MKKVLKVYMWFFAAIMFSLAWDFSDTNGVFWMMSACVSFSFGINAKEKNY